MGLFIAICWVNWHSRNLFIFEGNKKYSQVSLAKAEAIVEAYRKIKPLSLPSPQSQTSLAEQTWKPSPVGCLKINVYASTNRQNKVASLGFVIRDSREKFVATAQKQKGFFRNALSALTKAIQFGFEVAEATGCRPLIIESDCQEVVTY